MRDRPVTNPAPTPAAFINAQNAITGLRGRDLLSTLRTVAAHGLRNPLHTAPRSGPERPTGPRVAGGHGA
ncbi:poly(R)-hydroxyalkanoic acid synthase, class II [Pseudomonas sp. 28 E 9]|nr:poly(R)-hydroxyalkanoic acid synthase, class II [Pseudomonas sp. 28 E 9]